MPEVFLFLQNASVFYEGRQEPAEVDDGFVGLVVGRRSPGKVECFVWEVDHLVDKDEHLFVIAVLS